MAKAALSRLMILFIILTLFTPITSITLISQATAEHYVMEIGSKSNPNAHLFAYDQKFR